MSKNTSISLGGYFEDFINQQVEKGRFGSASEAIRAGLRLLIQEEIKLETLRRSLEAGEQSGRADYSLNELMNELDNE
ncbi:type II toxin-antitoxin system ParD family antitoxin [Pseudopedobacter beijingensis]|uniref:Type II toxin-antitoxin system ParD family antitoxin n=1 Tax=Pseudopedobacter beijingensis TaxID=1207056 RepID=A0ABW4IDN5_9SPHI